MLRGGSWGNDDPENLRCATRNDNDPRNSNDNIGFRVVCVRVSASGGRPPSMGRVGAMPRGNRSCTARAKRSPNRPDHALVEGERHGAYVRYTDDFLLFGDDRRELWRLRGRVVEELARVRLKLAVPKSRLLATREGVPFCGFLFRPGLAPRVIGATKRRFHGRLRGLIGQRRIREASSLVRAWFAFSMEGNSLGLRRGLG